MGREDDGGSLLLQCEDFLADQLGIHRVKTAERLVQYHQGRLVDHRGDELDLLGHTLGEFLNLLLPPVLDTELHEPFLEFALGVAGTHSLELGQVHGLVADLHLAVKSPFLRKIANPLHVPLGYRPSIENDLTRIRYGNPVDNSYQCSLSGSVRSEETENLSGRNVHADIVESDLFAETFADVPAFNQSHDFTKNYQARMRATSSTRSSSCPASPLAPPFPL